MHARTDDGAALLDAAMERFAGAQPALPIAVAYSGGADSSALLHACHARWPQQTIAWHVHHGLQPAADDFERHARATCARLGIPFHAAHVDAHAAARQSPEDAARIARYGAFADLHAASRPRPATVVLAQHADDQVETVLLALARGAGLPGLAAMPARWELGGLHYCRPLLEVPRAVIRAWLRAHGFSWVEDPTNAELRYTRNRIRLELVPVLESLFPAFRTTFARSARHAAQAQEILDTVARQDLAACGIPPRIADLRALAETRQGNLLRHWLHASHGQIPSSAQLRELQSQLRACRTRGHDIDIRVGGGFVRRHGDVIDWSGDDAREIGAP